MQSITLQSHVGKDGILQVQVPAEFSDADVQVTLALSETHKNGAAKSPEDLGWPPGFFEETFGCLPDFPEIDSEGDYEKREELS